MIFFDYKMQQKYAYVRISNFKESYKRNKKYCDSINEMKQIIENNKNTPDLSIFEVLENNIRRVYFDIEKIPFEEDKMIYDIITRLATFMKIDPNNYALTLNTGSHHPGLSYHLTFPFKTHASNILNLVRSFKLKYPEYTEYIDECVYNVNRLFRVPYQYGIAVDDEVNGSLALSKWMCYNTTHGTDTIEVDKYKDVHRIQYGRLEDLIIQNINEIPMLEKVFNSVSYKKLPMRNISYPKMTNTIIELMQNVNDNNHETIKENICLLKEDINTSRHKYNIGTIKEIIHVMCIFIMFVILMLK